MSDSQALPSSEPTRDIDRVTNLRHALHGVVEFGNDLNECYLGVQRNLRLQGVPTWREYEFAATDGPLPRHACSNAWVNILRTCNENLMPWWTCWNDANVALDELPKHLVDNQAFPRIERWSFQVRRWLNEQSLWMQWLNPQLAIRDNATRLDGFVQLAKNDNTPDSWPDGETWLNFDRDLQTIQNDMGYRPGHKPKVYGSAGAAFRSQHTDEEWAVLQERLSTGRFKELGDRVAEAARSAMSTLPQLMTPHIPQPAVESNDTSPTPMGDTEPTAGENAAEPVHSDDFRSVRWFGESYAFTGTQAACVKTLWNNWKRGTPVISELTILDAASSESVRLRDVFKSGKSGLHPSWGTVIVKVGKDGFRLAEPEKPSAP